MYKFIYDKENNMRDDIQVRASQYSITRKINVSKKYRMLNKFYVQSTFSSYFISIQNELEK